MASIPAERFLVVDVGTSKVAALAADTSADQVEVRAARTAPWDRVEADGSVDPAGASPQVADVIYAVARAVGFATDSVRVVGTSVRGAVAAVERAGFAVSEIVSAPVASAAVVCERGELDRGVVVVDLGAAETRACVVVGGRLEHVLVVPGGGRALTHDLACGLGLDLAEAELVKRSDACALSWLVPETDRIELPAAGGLVPRRRLGELCSRRLDATLALLAGRLGALTACRGRSLTCVLTGGGAALPGLVELTEVVLGLPTRVGGPRRCGGLDLSGALELVAASGVAAIAAGRGPASLAPETLVPPSVVPVGTAVAGR